MSLALLPFQVLLKNMKGKLEERSTGYRDRPALAVQLIIEFNPATQ